MLVTIFGVFVLSSSPELQNQAADIQVNQIDYYWNYRNGDRMKFLEMMRKTTIVQRILIGGSIVWILWEPRGLVDFVEGLILIFIVWGLYWIITEFMKQRKNK